MLRNIFLKNISERWCEQIPNININTRWNKIERENKETIKVLEKSASKQFFNLKVGKTFPSKIQINPEDLNTDTWIA